MQYQPTIECGEHKSEVTDLLKHDKLNLDIFWLKDDSLDDIGSLPPPDEIAIEIESLQAALEAFQSVEDDLTTHHPHRAHDRGAAQAAI